MHTHAIHIIIIKYILLIIFHNPIILRFGHSSSCRHFGSQASKIIRIFTSCGFIPRNNVDPKVVYKSDTRSGDLMNVLISTYICSRSASILKYNNAE